MKNRLQLSSSLSPNKFLDVAYVFTHESTCQKFDRAGKGGTRLFVESDQKRDQAKSTASKSKQVFERDNNGHAISCPISCLEKPRLQKCNARFSAKKM